MNAWLGVTFPFWGLGLLVFMCRKFKVHGTLGDRAIRAFVIGLVAALLLTPAMWGAEGFGLFVPWWAVFFDPEHTLTAWQAGIFAFTVAAVGNFVAGKGRTDGRDAG